jgi:hypothetical protein
MSKKYEELTRNREKLMDIDTSPPPHLAIEENFYNFYFSLLAFNLRLNMELHLQGLFGLHVQCTAVLIG